MRFYISTQSQIMVVTAMSIVAILALGLIGFFAVRYLSEMLEGASRGEAGMNCRSCKSKSIHPSFPSGLVDTAFSVFGCLPYRCDVCNFRFYIRRPTSSASVTTH